MRVAIGRVALAAWCAAVCACDDGGAGVDGGGAEGDGVVADGAPGDARPLADGAPPAGDARAPEDAGPPPTDGGSTDARGPHDVGPIRGATPNFMGRVMGRVFVRTGPGVDDRAPLTGAEVRLEQDEPRRVGEWVVTDGEGRYEIPPHPLGTYRVCARAGRLGSACHPEPVEITEDSPYHARHVELRAWDGALRGRVLLADGSPCARRSEAFGTTLTAAVTLQAPDGEVLAEGETDGDAAFVLTGLTGVGGYRVVADCGGSAGEVDWVIDEADFEPDAAARSVDVLVDNTPPAVGAMSFEAMDGTPLFQGEPGSQVRVRVEARDDDGDPLTWRFVDAHGAPMPGDGDGTATITLPAASSQLIVLAEVSDGRGGYGEARGVLRVTTMRPAVSGHVLDADGLPIEGATVSITRTQVQTDAEGFFRLEPIFDGPFVLRVRADGFADGRRAFERGQDGVRFVLRPMTRHVLSVHDEHTVQDEAGLVQLYLPQGILDQGGRGAPQQAEVSLVGYDPRLPARFPGGKRVQMEDGEVRAARLFAAADVTVRTDGADHGLQGRRRAVLSFPAPPGDERPEALDLLRLDENSGLWVVEGEATLDGNVYRAEVDHFSAWSVGIVAGDDEACIRVDVAPELLGQFVLRARVPYAGPPNSGGVVSDEWIPTQSINVVRGLPPFEVVYFDILSLTDPTQLIDWKSATSANPAVNGIFYPYVRGNEGCNGWLRIDRVLPRERWLDRIVNTTEEGWDYYAMLGYEPGLTLAQWKQMKGFTAQDEAAAVAFYNPQEFGLGRRGVCHAEGSTPEDITMACCVAKYGHVGGPVVEALDDTVHDEAVGDTVCMEYTPGPEGPRIVKFLAFTPEGDLTPTTYFDTSGPKRVPGVCGHCHGRTQDWKENGGDQGGRFVFFDAPAYAYAHWAPGWSKPEQEERLRALNRLVKLTHGNTGPYAEYIDSLYHPDVDTPGATTSTPDPLPGWLTHAQAYNQVVRPNCRTCHIWQPGPFALTAPEPGIGGFLRSYLCDGIMPNAMQPTLNVWRKLDPFLGDALTSAYQTDACFSDDARPTVTILEPEHQAEIAQGGFFGLRLRAVANDVEDGPDCCALTWTSDRDGHLGFGPDLSAALSTVGVHTLTVSARDSRYRVGTDSVQVRVSNDPPVPSIDAPAMDFDSLYEGIPYVLRGSATDPNQVLGVPCDRLQWTSDDAGDAPFPYTGCHPEVAFQGNGQRTLTLRATDAFNVSRSVSRVVNVPDPPLNAPPIVTLLSPIEGNGYAGNQAFQVRGSAVDPDMDSVIDWTLRARRVGGDGVVVDSGQCAAGAVCQPTLSWRPLDGLGYRCGGYEAVMTLEATDDDGTSQTSVTFFVAFPPC